jgi:hypothetical protein
MIKDVIMREIEAARAGGGCHFENYLAQNFENYLAAPAARGSGCPPNAR